MRSFYAERDYLPVWNADGRFESSSRMLLGIIGAAGKQALSPEFYHLRQIESVTRLPYERYSPADKAGIDLLFSDALLAYGNDLLVGRARRVELKYSAINAVEDVSTAELLNAALSSGDLQQVVERSAPVPAAYQRLLDLLLRFRELAGGEKPFQLPARTLREGDTGGEVAALRRRLAFLGDLPQSDNDNSGVFDQALARTVKRFQDRHGLEPDGVVGRETRAALQIPVSRRVEQIELNLERWRWLPRDPGGRYLVVNIAGQELNAVEDDRETLHMRVIVGRPFQKTPSFTSNINTVVLNPYWEVPHSIAINEILPVLRSDPEYLSRENMQVLKRTDGGGQPVDPATIDWQTVPVRNFPYRFRQRPGPDNALGRVKFLLPNPYNVYLHDTPAKTLFSRARRCFSHGCVRLEKPFELADLLLRDEPGWSSERREKILGAEQDYRISLTNPMPVYLVYWTAWVDDQGTAHFRDDVYGRDEQLRSALNAL